MLLLYHNFLVAALSFQTCLKLPNLSFSLHIISTCQVNCLAFNPFNEWVVATGSTDKTVKLFDLRKINTALHTFDCHK